jgi:putative N6-adenine-specific DNA methylase
LIGLEKAPGLLRSAFAFQHLKGFDREAWQSLRRSARMKTKKSLDWRIIATDHDAESIHSTQQNARTAGVDHLLEYRVCDFSNTPIPQGRGIVLLNPEYGKRLGELKRLTDVYKSIGDFFKQKCPGYKGYIFTGNLDLAKQVGLRTKRRIPFFNSEIECRLLEYDLYAGSKSEAHAR